MSRRKPIIQQRLASVEDGVRRRLDNLESMLPARSGQGEMPLDEYLAAARARAEMDPDFAAQLAASWRRYSALRDKRGK